jgi:hypothetical protein
MAKKSRPDEQAYPEEEAERRFDAAVVKALNTPPKPRSKPKRVKAKTATKKRKPSP